MSINTPLSKPSTSFWNQLEWHPSNKQLNQLIQLQALLKYWNNQINLTRLVDHNDYWISHVFDSLWPLRNKITKPIKNFNCIDVGSGCGFPGIAVSIAMDEAQLTLVESNSKKAKVLQEISKELKLSSRIIVLNERVEDTGKKEGLRGNFDIAMARAVAVAPVVAEYLVPLLNTKGEAFIYKGKWNQTDEQNLNKALIVLNAKIKKIQRNCLPDGRGERHLIRVISIDNCPEEYPRSRGVPQKRPLGN